MALFDCASWRSHLGNGCEITGQADHILLYTPVAIFEERTPLATGLASKVHGYRRLCTRSCCAKFLGSCASGLLVTVRSFPGRKARLGLWPYPTGRGRVPWLTSRLSVQSDISVSPRPSCDLKCGAIYRPLVRALCEMPSICGSGCLRHPECGSTQSALLPKVRM
ncbi:hypothetical protein T440DRAFT_209990 [Plenodomus tracheiphilus IPT5]|uniref:Uncharacterized protein n=1 Tax=Plenodomus tracheiphilus IPT5 TaxID=1408161 RepID=A0A6A7BLM4_9PLEO|nr:hypothetical protein T440DRAFT_209990 [Plenodomus tracheiphilus IPT5]